MIDKSQRFGRPQVSLFEIETLKGKQLEFESVAQMIATRAREVPDTVHTLYYDEVITYSQMNERANRVANFLKEKGVAKGDIVSVMVLNAPEIYYTMFGIQKLGAVAGSINYMLKGPEIAYVLQDSRPKFAFVGSEYMIEFAKGIELSSHKPVIIEVVTEVRHDITIASGTLETILHRYPADECLVSQSLDDPFLLLYSSGTTGAPKGILTTNRNQLAICKAMAKMKINKPGDIWMILLPMFHTNPLCVGTYPYTYQGLTICIRKSFSPSDFWPAITRYGVTVVMAVPTMWAYVYNVADPASIDREKLKLRYAFAGSAPMPLELVRGFKDKFGVQVIDGYGLTEATGVSTLSFAVPENLKSVGIPIYGQEVEIMDDSNQILPYGENGEVCIKGEAVMLGYLNKPEETA